MAKRFTDTDKWKKKFIRGLDAPYKVLWLYILDDCNHAGMWDVDIEVASIRTGCSFYEATAIEKFGNKIKIFDDGEKWFIQDFIDFQYGILNPKNRVHESVLSLLTNYKNKGLIRGLLDPKDKDKDKDKLKDKEKGKLIYPFDSKIFIDKWELWKKYRTEIKKSIKGAISEQAALNDLNKLSNSNEKTAIKIIDQSISKNWQGLFELKTNNSGHLPAQILKNTEQSASILEKAKQNGR